ncbi:11548_t:CDS:2, partial [Gigaspora margarita]
MTKNNNMQEVNKENIRTQVRSTKRHYQHMEQLNMNSTSKEHTDPGSKTGTTSMNTFNLKFLLQSANKVETTEVNTGQEPNINENK